MLIYEKKNSSDVRCLFGTMSNLPKDTDKELIYKDEEGNTVDVKEYTLFYNKNGGIFASKVSLPTEDDIQLLVYIYGEENPIWQSK